MTAPNGLTWQTSSACNNGSCLEVSRTKNHVLLRDSNDPEQRVVAVTVEEFAAFLIGAKAGEFDGMGVASPVSGVPAGRPASPLSNADD